MQKTTKKKTSIYLDADLVESLEQLCRKEERTLTYVLNKMLRAGFDYYENEYCESHTINRAFNKK